MNYMKSLLTHWTSIAAALAAVLPFLMPSLLAYISAHPHTTLAVFLGGAIAAYNATAPKDKTVITSANLQGIKMLLVGLLVFAFCGRSSAQTSTPPPAPSATLTNIYAAGISGNTAGSPPIAGTALYAHALGDTGTYAFTVIDALPASARPLTVTTNISAGVSQKLFSLGSVPIFVPTSAGVSFNGTNTGWAWSTGALASIKIKNNWRVFPNVRIVKSSVSNGTGYQPIVGVLFGWGK